MSKNSSRALFEPQGVIFNPVKRALATVRRISLTVFFLIIAAPIVVMTQILEEFPQPLLYAALVCVGLLWLYFLWLIGRQVRNLAWAQGEHDFLIRRGAFFRSMTIVPYGRIQYVRYLRGADCAYVRNFLDRDSHGIDPDVSSPPRHSLRTSCPTPRLPCAARER